eukprot:1144453-Pelagomonas_calceolata.AAC.8
MDSHGVTKHRVLGQLGSYEACDCRAGVHAHTNARGLSVVWHHNRFGTVEQRLRLGEDGHHVKTLEQGCQRVSMGKQISHLAAGKHIPSAIAEWVTSLYLRFSPTTTTSKVLTFAKDSTRCAASTGSGSWSMQMKPS